MMVSPMVAFPEPSFPTLVVGDFNIHHPLPDPLRTHSAEELATFFPYFSRLSESGFGLLNQPGVYTRFLLGGFCRPSILDPSFASPSLLPFCQAWDTPPPLHWFRPFPHSDHTLTPVLVSSYPLAQLVPDRLAHL